MLGSRVCRLRLQVPSPGAPNGKCRPEQYPSPPALRYAELCCRKSAADFCSRFQVLLDTRSTPNKCSSLNTYYHSETSNHTSLILNCVGISDSEYTFSSILNKPQASQQPHNHLSLIYPDVNGNLCIMDIYFQVIAPRHKF